MKQLIIAEKPSVATDLAKALGVNSKTNDHYEDDSTIISSALGLLVISLACGCGESPAPVSPPACYTRLELGDRVTSVGSSASLEEVRLKFAA